jgi:hypothetical protein
MEGGGQILAAYTPETGAEYRAKNREIKSASQVKLMIMQFHGFLRFGLKFC